MKCTCNNYVEEDITTFAGKIIGKCCKNCGFLAPVDAITRKVLDEKPADYMATIVLAVTDIDGSVYVIQKAICIDNPSDTCWFKLPFLKEDEL